jgi:methylmalonyl-CoA mutase
VHSRAWHEAGGSAVQELAFMLAMAVEYFREMHRRGLDVEVVAPRLAFRHHGGRALLHGNRQATRVAHALVARGRALGGSPSAQEVTIHVRTSRWNKTVYDPYNNMLRSTVEAFRRGAWGCDSMQVGAFDEVIRRRTISASASRATPSSSCKSECHLDHVIDPAGGSWFVESLTAELAERAWALFQEVEKLGGMAAALQSGFPQKAVAATASERKLKA